jgi:hypothetical protein
VVSIFIFGGLDIYICELFIYQFCVLYLLNAVALLSP